MIVNHAIYRIGFWAGFIAFASTLAYVIVQVLQVISVLSYPLDEILIYTTSLLIVVPFVLEMLAFHYLSPPAKKFWSHASLIFSVVYAVFVTANYVVQLATVIPMKLKGNIEQVRLLEQTPHSLFWNFDAIGYIFMGLATLMAIPVFEKSGFQKWVRLSFLANALVTPLIAVVYFYPNYSERLLFLGFPWGITATLSMLLLAVMFKKDYDKKKHSQQYAIH